MKKRVIKSAIKKLFRSLLSDDKLQKDRVGFTTLDESDFSEFIEKYNCRIYYNHMGTIIVMNKKNIFIVSNKLKINRTSKLETKLHIEIIKG